MVRPHQLLWPAPNPEDAPGGLLGFSATALVVGALTGLVTGSFRLALDAVSAGRTWLVGWARGTGARALLLVVLLCAAATAAAASLVHRIEPHAEGSGIPRVEGVVEGRVPPGRPLILPVKYVGSLLAIGAGLALGHEGPSVQMGGNIGIIASRIGRRNRHDLRILVAAGAAAGLATAFNAPIAASPSTRRSPPAPRAPPARTPPRRAPPAARRSRRLRRSPPTDRLSDVAWTPWRASRSRRRSGLR